jgi:hypothetical protein
MVLVMVQVHGLFVDVGFQRVVCVRKRRYFVGRNRSLCHGFDHLSENMMSGI